MIGCSEEQIYMGYKLNIPIYYIWYTLPIPLIGCFGEQIDMWYMLPLPMIGCSGEQIDMWYKLNIPMIGCSGEQI